jgi:hypothetical protein
MIILASALAAGCLDLELLDNMQSTDTESSAAGGSGREFEEGDGTPAADPSDVAPPVIVETSCSPQERLGDGVCVAEGAAGASFRFDTDEPAVVTLLGPDDQFAIVFSETWATSHHAALLGMTAVATSATVTVRDVNGNEASREMTVTGNGGVPVAITEVLADPLGPEPDQEFVEIANVGGESVDLSGWMIDDNGDANGDILPDGTTLGPGQAAVIVGPAYDPSAPEEPALASNALLITLDSSIASNGLKNSEAETLELYDASGNLVSSYPGGAGTPAEGISAVRLAAELPDGDPLAFAPAPNGAATPGTI